MEFDSVSTAIFDKLQSSRPNLKKLTFNSLDTIFDGKNKFIRFGQACYQGIHVKILDLVAARLRAMS